MPSWYAASTVPPMASVSRRAMASPNPVERRPVYEDGRPVYDGDKLQTTTVETMRYKSTPSRHTQPQKRPVTERKPPNRKKP